MLGTLLMILGIGLVAYFCCIRRRPKFRNVAAHDDDDGNVNFPSPSSHPTTGNVVTVGDYTPAFDSQVPAHPIPMPPDRDFYPVSFVSVLELLRYRVIVSTIGVALAIKV